MRVCENTCFLFKPLKIGIFDKEPVLDINEINPMVNFYSLSSNGCDEGILFQQIKLL